MKSSLRPTAPPRDSRPTPSPLTPAQSKLLDTPHGMFTRQGGVSREPFASLNLGRHVRDDPALVDANRELIKKSLKIQYLVSAKQVHSDRVALVDTAQGDREIADSDALITKQPGVGLLIQQADCQAVLLHDPRNQAVAAIHCGWRGSVVNIIAKTIDRMRAEFSSSPEDLIAAISPSLGPCCAEFIHFQREFPAELHDYQVQPNYFDFWRISCDQLRRAGLRRDNIDINGRCTVCDTDFFSYRRTRRKGLETTGRNGSVIALG